MSGPKHGIQMPTSIETECVLYSRVCSDLWCWLVPVLATSCGVCPHASPYLLLGHLGMPTNLATFLEETDNDQRTMRLTNQHCAHHTSGHLRIPSFLFYLYARQHLVLRYTRMPLELASGTTEHLAVSHEVPNSIGGSDLINRWSSVVFTNKNIKKRLYHH